MTNDVERMDRNSVDGITTNGRECEIGRVFHLQESPYLRSQFLFPYSNGLTIFRLHRTLEKKWFHSFWSSTMSKRNTSNIELRLCLMCFAASIIIIYIFPRSSQCEIMNVGCESKQPIYLIFIRICSSGISFRVQHCLIAESLYCPTSHTRPIASSNSILILF